MTATMLDTDVLDALDFDFQPPCDEEGCDNEPAVVTRLICCYNEVLLCDSCWAGWLEDFDRCSLWPLKCMLCNVNHPAGVQPLEYIGRIKK